MIYLLYNINQMDDMHNHNKFHLFLYITFGILAAIITLVLAPLKLAAAKLGQTATPATASSLQPQMPAGNTDGIILWGTLLVIIVVIAIIWHRPDWTPKKPKNIKQEKK